MKKYKKQIKELLESCGIELSTKESLVNDLVKIIKAEVVAKEHFRKQRDEALIKSQDKAECEVLKL